MTNEGHRDTWAAPAKGWPTFDADGRIIEEDEESQKSIDTVQPD